MTYPWQLDWSNAKPSDAMDDARSRLASAGRGAMQGATLGWSDEIKGGLGAAYARMTRPELFQDQTVGETYRQGRDMERSADKEAQDKNPGTYGAAEFAGGMLTPAVGLSGTPSAARLAAVGGGYGAGSAAGYSKAEDVKDIMKDAALGGAIGGVATPALGKGVQYLQENPEMLKTFLTDERGMFGGVNAVNANKETLALAEKLVADGADPKAIWKQTGWFKGVDGKWRFEIDDSGAKLKDYFQSPAEAYQNTRERAFINDDAALRATAEAMSPYQNMSGDELRNLYKLTGEKIAQAATSGDTELALKLNQERSGLSSMLSEMANRKYGPASAYMNHEQLAASYPDVADIHTRIAPDDVSGHGSYHQGSDTRGEQIALNQSPTFNSDKSTLLHELQHAIQQREGFARGGSSDGPYAPGVRDQLIKEYVANFGKDVLPDNPYSAGAYQPTPDELKQMAARWIDSPEGRMAAYRRLAGETEARLVQSRMNMTPEQRAASYPPDMYDVPAEQQIVRYGDGEMRSDGENAIIKKAIETWGLTHDPAEAAYILPDGRMIDGSGKAQVGDYARNGDYHIYQGKGRDYMSGQRVVDHREISQSVTPNGGEGGTESMYNFIRQTNSVRYQPGVGASFMGMPTDRQIQQIIKSHKLTGGGDPFFGDVYDSKGNWLSEFSIDVPSGAKLKQQLKNTYTNKDQSISGSSDLVAPAIMGAASLGAAAYTPRLANRPAQSKPKSNQKER